MLNPTFWEILQVLQSFLFFFFSCIHPKLKLLVDMTYQSTRMTLIKRVKDRLDDNSWEEFTQTYQPYIMTILHRSGIPSSHIQDLCQDILLKIWKSIESFEYDPEKCTFRTWLSVVCRNTVYKFSAKQKKLAIDDVEVPHIADEAEIDHIIEREWRLYIAAKALESVSRQFNKNALEAYRGFHKGQSVEDIAQSLEISESSIYVYNKRVKDAMSREIILLSRELN